MLKLSQCVLLSAAMLLPMLTRKGFINLAFPNYNWNVAYLNATSSVAPKTQLPRITDRSVSVGPVINW